MLLFARRRRHLARLLEVAAIVVKYGGYHLVDYLGLRDVAPAGMRSPPSEADLASKLRAAIEELGPTYVKLGQVLSTRPDLVPTRYLEELTKLQDTAPPVPFDRIRRVVEGDLGRPLEDAFQFFSEHPLAAASLAQAHAAVLRDGTPVVVKVQRPGIRRIIETDIEIILDRAHWLTQRSERARVLNLVDLVEEFQITTREELDYTREGRSMDRLRELLRGHRRIHIPRVHWELTTPRVLTQERIHGTKVTDAARLRELGVDPHSVAHFLGDAFMQMIFLDGFFHADPHPGNIIVTDEGIVTLLDFGMVCRIDESMRESVTRLLISFVEEDSRFFAEEVLELGQPLREIDRKRFTSDIDRVLRRYYDLPARDVNIGEVLNDVLRLTTDHALQMPSHFGLLVKVLANLDGIAKQLDPEFGYLDSAKRFLGRAVTERLQWPALRLDLYRSASEIKRLLTDLPMRTNQILTKAAEGDLRIQIEPRGIDDLTRHLDKIGNRIAYSLVVAALLVGSALFTQAKVGPVYHNYPVIGMVSFLAAVAMGIWLLIAILRSGNLR